MMIKSYDDYVNVYTKPKLREKLKEQIMKGSKGGKTGQWSARKAQILNKTYESKGGRYKNRDHRTAAQKSLQRWSAKNNVQ